MLNFDGEVEGTFLNLSAGKKRSADVKNYQWNTRVVNPNATSCGACYPALCHKAAKYYLFASVAKYMTLLGKLYFVLTGVTTCINTFARITTLIKNANI